MDYSYNMITSNTWDLDMTMEGKILHDQIPCDLFWPNLPLQTHQISPQKHVIMPPSFSIDQVERQKEEKEEPEEELGAMKEMMYKIAAMQPVDIDPSTIRKPKRRNVRISDDPQSIAARHRREKISEKIRVLQRLVPGGTKMDTASMLDEAIRYVKFLKKQVKILQSDQPSQDIGVTAGTLTDRQWQIMSCKTNGSMSSSSSIEPSRAAGFTFGGGDISCDSLLLQP